MFLPKGDFITSFHPRVRMSAIANFALGARAGLFWRPSRYSYLRGGKCEF